MSFSRELTKRAVDVPLYRTFRAFRKPLVPPLHIAISVTRRCNERCMTCNTWEMPVREEMDLNEYALLFKSFKYSPLALTFTGGEPLIRDDFAGIVALGCGALEPAAVFIETCGDMPVRLNAAVRRLKDKFPDTHFCVRMSLPATLSRFDAIRATGDGSFETFLRSFSAVNAIGANNVSVELRIPVSHYNEKQAPAIIDQAFLMYPDLVSVFPAYGSEELGVSAAEFMPSPEGFGEAVKYYLQKSRGAPGRGFTRAMWPLLRKSAGLSAAALRKMKQPVACQAGYASIFISPDGLVTDCPVASRELGSLREYQFDIGRILNSRPAAEVRKKVDSSRCFCPMEYASFATCMLSASAVARVFSPLR